MLFCKPSTDRHLAHYIVHFATVVLDGNQFSLIHRCPLNS